MVAHRGFSSAHYLSKFLNTLKFYQTLLHPSTLPPPLPPNHYRQKQNFYWKLELNKRNFSSSVKLFVGSKNKFEYNYV